MQIVEKKRRQMPRSEPERTCVSCCTYGNTRRKSAASTLTRCYVSPIQINLYVPIRIFVEQFPLIGWTMRSELWTLTQHTRKSCLRERLAEGVCSSKRFKYFLLEEISSAILGSALGGVQILSGTPRRAKGGVDDGKQSTSDGSVVLTCLDRKVEAGIRSKGDATSRSLFGSVDCNGENASEACEVAIGPRYVEECP